MTDRLRELASIGSAAIGVNTPDLAQLERSFGPFASQNIGRILRIKNGFYAFEAALHVMPDVGTARERGLFDWNEAVGWRGAYEGMADAAVFFAEDVFGAQFCVYEGAIATFDPETGSFERMAADVGEWAARILADYPFWTGHGVAHAWQSEHGPLPVGSRLVPTTPFVLGGKYEASNVRAVDAVEGMRFRASIAGQIRELPDGTPITLRVIE